MLQRADDETLGLFCRRERQKAIAVGLSTRERSMKHLAFALGLLAVGFVATTPAHADYAVVQFGDGFCQVWWDSSGTPWGIGWTKLAVGLPDPEAAHMILDRAATQGVCR